MKHIYAGSQLVATLENAAVQYIHTDHLTGSNVATNNSGTLVQLLDYYPYGSMRIDQSSTFDEQRKFTGHMYDRDTSLTYANARYYKQNIGRFLSQDPAYLNLSFKLKDPQSLNSYAYSRNNPLLYVDPDGKQFQMFQSAMMSLQRVNNQTNGYVAREVQSTAEGVKQAATVAGTAFVAGAAIVGANVAGAPAVMSALTNPATLGAASNVAQRAYWDYKDNNSIDDVGSQYGVSAILGAVGGKYLSGLGILQTAVGAGVIEGFEGIITDGHIDLASVAGNALGAGFTKGVFAQHAGQALRSVFDISFTRMSEAATELITSVASTQVIKNIFDEDRN